MHYRRRPRVLRPARRAGAVLFISEDSPDSVVQEYIETLCDLYDIRWEGLPFYVNEQHGLRIESVDDLPKAKEAYESCPQAPVYVIVDSCESLVPSESFTLKEFDAFGQFLRWMSDRGAAIEVIDHARKESKDAGTNLLEKLYGSIAKGKIADIAVYLEGSFRTATLRQSMRSFRGNFPCSRSRVSQRHRVYVEGRVGWGSTPTERKITKWFNEQRIGWYTASRLSTVGISERSARRALPRPADIRWLLCDGGMGRDGLATSATPTPERSSMNAPASRGEIMTGTIIKGCQRVTGTISNGASDQKTRGPAPARNLWLDRRLVIADSVKPPGRATP